MSVGDEGGPDAGYSGSPMSMSGASCATAIATRLAASSRRPAVTASQRTGNRKSPPKPDVPPPAAVVESSKERFVTT